MRIVVIGAGLGGMSSAIRLAAAGHDVMVVEKGERVGGKLNVRESQGFRFDTGPSILTMPWVLEELFEKANRKLSDYVKLVRVEPEWRAFWPDGSRFDMQADLVEMVRELQSFSPEDASALLPYLTHAQNLYNLTEKGFYRNAVSGLGTLRSLHSWRELLKMEPMKTVHQVTSGYFTDKRLQQLFDFLVMYVGSNPYTAPAILTQLGHVQMGLGVWYVDGGMYNIARAMERVLLEYNANIQLNTEVKQILVERGQAAGIITADGETIAADLVVCNLEAPTAWRTLLTGHPKQPIVADNMKKFAPSVSGLVMLLGLDDTYPQLAHHNFFFSEDPTKEFEQVFQQKVPADDPTIYIGVSCRSDASQAPAGKDNLFILTHVPPLAEGATWAEYSESYREVVYSKLERLGLTDLRRKVQWSYEFTPDDLQQLYGANGGSIYGVVSDKKMNGGFKVGNRSEEVGNLYFVGGSTHPGGGVPMVTLSGSITAEAIFADLETAGRKAN